MQLLDLTLPSVHENVALDEALLLQGEADEAGEVLRLWEWLSPAVVLGSGGILADDVQVTACEADGVPLVRRSSGGGTVLLGTGCLCFSLVLLFEDNAALAEIRPSYQLILGRLVEVFGLPGVRLEGISDLTRDGRKFSGNAQQRKRRYVLHHGTILYDFDLSRVGRYLQLPPRQPAYREGRTHEDFVCNLDVSRPWLVERLQRAWPCDGKRHDWPEQTVRRLVAEKYGTQEWTRRR
jgi:lipoate-protein ligase A